MWAFLFLLLSTICITLAFSLLFFCYKAFCIISLCCSFYWHHLRKNLFFYYFTWLLSPALLLILKVVITYYISSATIIFIFLFVVFAELRKTTLSLIKNKDKIAFGTSIKKCYNRNLKTKVDYKENLVSSSL